MNLIDFQKRFSSEAVCLEYLEQMRWPEHRYCPHCGSLKNYKFKDGKLFKCGDCRKQFTVKVGTIFSDSKIPLEKWFMAIYVSTSLKKGISSIQLSKYIGVTQKSAWFMLQRIRYALEVSGSSSLLEGSIEVDETYIGGKRKLVQKYDNKSVVFGMVERGGRAKMKHVKSSGSRVLLPQVQASVKVNSTVYSDEWGAYKTLPKLGYPHKTVKHYNLEFKRGNAHTNTVEGLWSHFKRGIDGIYIHVSPKHLQKYCSEYEYRYNTRDLTDIDRFSQWFGYSLCRLRYNDLIGVKSAGKSTATSAL